MKPVIFGLSGLTLTPEERSFFEEVLPVGYVLFSRNCHSIDQIRTLVGDLRSISGPETYICIDQEGGRVQRLKKIHSFSSALEACSHEDTLRNHVTDISQFLNAININVNFAPCCDILIKEAHEIIGDRVLSLEAGRIAEKACTWIQIQREHGIISTIKHLPGHGRSKNDSHEELPYISASFSDLETDMNVFKKIVPQNINPSDTWGMTAHIVYEALDANSPATHSEIVIRDWIREFIGFKGPLITDCLSMKALSGTLTERTEKALKAGCDIVLYCEPNLSHQEEIAAAC